MNRRRWLGVALLAGGGGLGLLLAPRMALAAWLAAWWWSVGLVLGCFTNAWMQRLTGGGWGIPLQAAAALFARVLPWLLLGAVPVALGLHLLYPWADPGGEWLHAYSQPDFPRRWLSPPFFLVRLALYLALWWWLARPASLAGKQRAALSLVLHAVFGSLAAVDLVGSLLPQWFSTAFGLVVLSSQALAGAAAAVLLFAWTPAAQHEGRAGVPLSRDLGNLLLMWTMTWGYLAFMQFLIIWSENIPREIAFYLPRLQTGWAAVGLALVLLQLVVPFLALLLRSVKDHPRRLQAVVAAMLAASALDTAWTVLPSVDAHTLHGWWLAPLLFAGFALLLLPPWRRDAHAGAATAEVPHAA